MTIKNKRFQQMAENIDSAPKKMGEKLVSTIVLSCQAIAGKHTDLAIYAMTTVVTHLANRGGLKRAEMLALVDALWSHSEMFCDLVDRPGTPDKEMN